MKSLLLLLAAATVADAVGVRGKPEREALFASHLGDRPHVDQGDEVEGRESRGSASYSCPSSCWPSDGQWCSTWKDNCSLMDKFRGTRCKSAYGTWMCKSCLLCRAQGGNSPLAKSAMEKLHDDTQWTTSDGKFS